MGSGASAEKDLAEPAEVSVPDLTEAEKARVDQAVKEATNDAWTKGQAVDAMGHGVPRDGSHRMVMDPGNIEQLRKNFAFTCPILDIGFVQTVTCLLDALVMMEAGGQLIGGLGCSDQKLVYESFFTFALIWTLGTAVADDAGLRSFKSMARGVKLPETGECFDYHFEVATKAGQGTGTAKTTIVKDYLAEAGSFMINGRLQRRFTVATTYSATAVALHGIYTKILGRHLQAGSTGVDEKKISTEELIKQVTVASGAAAVEREAARTALNLRPEQTRNTVAAEAAGGQEQSKCEALAAEAQRMKNEAPVLPVDPWFIDDVKSFNAEHIPDQVAPLIEKVKVADATTENAKLQLREAECAQLDDLLNNAMNEKEAMERQAQCIAAASCVQKLNTAQRLVAGLADENERTAAGRFLAVDVCWWLLNVSL
eukprot:Skav235398  [mRNA]  locus=scaffold487:77331:100245:- [translate_table: standard]